MADYSLQKLPKNSFEILLKLPKSEINDAYKKSFERLQNQLAVEGFRKGKVPKSIAEKHLKKEDIYQDLIKQLLPAKYKEIIDKEKFTPIVNPKIELTSAKEGEDWQVKITIALRPTIDIGDYKTVVRDVKAKFKKEDIWIPGKENPKKENNEENKQKALNEILTGLLKTTKFEISDMVLEEELNHRLAQLLDEIKKIGLTVDAYLKSKNLTMEELKKRYHQEIYDTYKLEFILQAIADQEKISVEKSDLDKLFSSIKDIKEKKSAEANAYFYASVLRKQKTIDFVLSL